MYDSEVSGTMYELSDTGWINSEPFDLQFIHHFLPHVPFAHPLFLLLDGLLSHDNPSVIKLLQNNYYNYNYNYNFLLTTTHIIQKPVFIQRSFLFFEVFLQEDMYRLCTQMRNCYVLMTLMNFQTLVMPSAFLT